MRAHNPLFEWDNVKMVNKGDTAYEMTAECTILQDGADPRALSLDVLKDAFHVCPGDKVEFTWASPIQMSETGPIAGMTVMVKATIFIGEKDSVLRIILDRAKLLDSELEMTQELFQKLTAEVEDPHEIMTLSSMNGMVVGLKAQVTMMIGIIEEQMRIEQEGEE
jgi:hypothetical protein